MPLAGRAPPPLPLLPLLPAACPRCRLRAALSRQRRARAATRHSSSHAAAPPTWTRLANKRLIRLCGADAAAFLHNIVPAKIVGVGTTPIYTAFLSAQGRILQDVFIYPPSWEAGDGERNGKPEWLVEVDAASAADLFKHLKRHKLRAKFALELIGEEEAAVWYRWPEQQQQQQQQQTTSSPAASISGVQGVRAGGRDPRPGMGTRLVLTRTDDHDAGGQQPDGQTASLEQYTVHRMVNGLAEGQREIISGHALPQECNLDLLGGIDFHKGCYLGQELTIRTHHTGVVRKRILPCDIVYAEGDGGQPPPPELNISKLTAAATATSTGGGGRSRSTGRWLGGVGNVGLALCRLEMMTDIQLTAETTTAGYRADDEYCVGGTSARIRPLVPAWVRAGIEQSLRRKASRSAARPRHDEDDDEEE